MCHKFMTHPLFLYLFLKDLFLQPSTYQIDDFLSGWLRERQDAGKM